MHWLCARYKYCFLRLRLRLAVLVLINQPTYVTIRTRSRLGVVSNVNKDQTFNAKDQDKEQTYKDKDQDKDQTPKDKDKDKDKDLGPDLQGQGPGPRLGQL